MMRLAKFAVSTTAKKPFNFRGKADQAAPRQGNGSEASLEVFKERLKHFGARVDDFGNRFDDFGKRLDDMASRIMSSDRSTLALFGFLLGGLYFTGNKFDKQAENFNVKIDKFAADVDAKFDKQAEKIDKLEADVNAKFDKQAENFSAKIDKLEADVNAKFDKQAEDSNAQFDKLWVEISDLKKIMSRDKESAS